MQTICDDLAAEHAQLDATVAAATAGDGADTVWSAATPSPGWTIGDQISHLWFFDRRALLALTDEAAFVADRDALMAGAAGADPSIEAGRVLGGSQLLANWRTDRAALVAAAREVDPSSRVQWYGPAMGARSFITARLMETWAHGQDVADALQLAHPPTARLRHVAHIGVMARPFSYAINAMTMPAGDVRVALLAPDGSTWAWGTEGSPSITGPAFDFCLVVTQRRHLADTALIINGVDAAEWMSIAQAYAGPPGIGRAPIDQ